MPVEQSTAERRPVYHEGVPSNRTLEHLGLRRRPRFVTEIGYGRRPSSIFGNLRCGEYVGFDYAENQGSLLASLSRESGQEFEKLKRRIRMGEKLSFLYGDAVRDEARERNGLSLPDNSASEVILSDVLNVGFRMGDRDRRAILQEARRIVEPNDGRLIVKISWFNDAAYRYRQPRVERLVTEAGFDLVDTVTLGLPEFDELQVRYGETAAFAGDINAQDYSAYYIIAKKTE